jgi:hypothetical protein
LTSSLAILPLLEDGALRVEADPALLSLLRRWLPLLPYGGAPDGPALGAAIQVVPGNPSTLRPAGAPALRLGSVDAWVGEDFVFLRGQGGCSGEGDLDGGPLLLTAPWQVIDPETDARVDADAVSWDLYSMLTLACALLLGRMGRALAHAAAVVAPDGRAWLLTGDTHAGKSTTCINLVEAGWGFVSDDHVVLARTGDGAVRVEGWPRVFHLDEGWEEGAPRRRRRDVDPHARWPGRWRRSAPVAGLLFPRVEAGLSTALSPLPAAEALAALLRQSPWLLADRACAGEVLGLLRAACSSPAFSLRLGLDTYRDTGRLLEVLAPLSDG